VEGNGLTALERHADYFDADRDGLVTLPETYGGLRRLGVGCVTSGILAGIINLFLGPITRGRASLTISVAHIAAGVHPFDTGVFNQRGELDRARFDALFAPGAERLTRAELRSVIVGRGRAARAGWKGWLANRFSAAEARLLFCLASDTTKTVDGRPEPAITKLRLLHFYQGRLLPALARRRRIANRKSG
jgi:peroxygenase